ncbi:MAG: enoyl-CoA hydratase/isomerase family protein [Cocleimonas sp.]|nr:enoyl-CoA hydratase/isomerase family protein [Cocleimonas sp.]
MTAFQHINLTRTKNDIIWLTINSQDSPTNALTISLLKEMREVIDNLHGKGFKGLIISSAKPNNFVSGIDLDTLLKLTTEKKAEIFTSLGNQVCRHISLLDFPSIALINGKCSNAGLEIALSCNYRIATNNSHFDYSDIKQGHYAGFGSITRLIQRKGLSATLSILNHKLYSAKEALSIGLIDYIVSAHKIHQAAQYVIAQENDESQHKKSSRFGIKALFKALLPTKLQASFIAKQYDTPVFKTIVETWKTFNTSPDACHNEAIIASKLLTSEVTRNHLSLQKLYQHLDHHITALAPQSQRIHIIGCGIMGRYIARCCASNGFYVSIYDTRHAALEKVLPELYQTFDQPDTQRQSIVDKIIIDMNNTGLTHADIIIEAIPENKHAKVSLLHDIDEQAKSTACILTTTACLPLEEISKEMNRPQRLAAFNPYHPLFKSSVVEISVHSDNPSLSEHLKAFAKTLQLKPIQVKSNSGYLGTRLLMTYLIESILIHQTGISTQAIDKLTTKMGMNHTPFDLIDTIGLNECLQVTEALADQLNYDVPSLLMQKNEQGLKGKESGAGFYRYKKGKKQLPILDKTLSSPSWKHKSKEIEKRLIEKIINEARSCLQQAVVNEQELIDLVATVITGFAAEKGGPLAYLEQLQSGKMIVSH